MLRRPFALPLTALFLAEVLLSIGPRGLNAQEKTNGEAVLSIEAMIPIPPLNDSLRRDEVIPIPPLNDSLREDEVIPIPPLTDNLRIVSHLDESIVARILVAIISEDLFVQMASDPFELEAGGAKSVSALVSAKHLAELLEKAGLNPETAMKASEVGNLRYPSDTPFERGALVKVLGKSISRTPEIIMVPVPRDASAFERSYVTGVVITGVPRPTVRR